MYAKLDYLEKRLEQSNYIFDKMNMTFSAVYKGKDKKDGWDCYHYGIKLTNTKTLKEYTTDFYNGVGHVFQHNNSPAAPLPFSVLSSIYIEDTRGADFEEWCSDLGYDTDSRKALAAYLQCQEQTSRFKKAFPNVHLEDYEEITEY